MLLGSAGTLLWLWRALPAVDPPPPNLSAEVPHVSVLVAARNEAPNIAACLDALLALEYPPDRLEIWIGDDASEDATAAVVQAYANRVPRVHLVSITDRVGQAQGKANVLAQLARRANGTLLAITDADIRVPRQWLHALVPACDVQTGLVSGVTEVTGDTLFSRLQGLDWLLALEVLRVLDVHRQPQTAIGNNMIIRKDVYEATGGYEAIPFSITEDLALFRVVRNLGYITRVLFQPEVLAASAPMPTLAAWLRQRRRWMRGGLTLPVALQAGLLVQLLTYPAVLLAFVDYPVLSCLLLGGRWAGVWLFARKGLKQLKRVHFLKYLLLYEGYAAALYGLLLLRSLLPGKVDWKGRSY
ncbi:glycosyltransferase [Catalinimonas alkaloidigena]|uniref:glycosyltransferase n=1 Tax=Catalinimonas alkaloidigena TaxID=1075417 RepID=UPI00159FE900|nr:glycosyltransferase [Catalinimonas alkaloidigena]